VDLESVVRILHISNATVYSRRDIPNLHNGFHNLIKEGPNLISITLAQ